MSITSIRLQNFRCFHDTGEIPIRPLTVIFGRNNAGKSSLLQAFFLLRQTLDQPESGDRLNMRGPLYPAGSYSDIVHQHQSRTNVVMEFGFRVPFAKRDAHIRLEFCSDEPQPPRLVSLRVHPAGQPLVEVRRGRGRGGPYELHIDGENVGLERAANFRFAVNQFLPLIGPEPLRRGRPSPRREVARSAARLVLREFQEELRMIRAVGPFRDQPTRRYDFQGRPAEAVDLHGESVVHALIDESTRRGKNRGVLLAALNRWLARVGRVRLMPLRRISTTARLYELRMRDLDSGRWANFADVGFGIGQALPVLVEGLRTPPLGVFIVQEPEIHLHPDAQLAMADYLIDLARSGRTVMVETHSEAVLLRIRNAAVEYRSQGKRPRLRADQIAVVHVSSRTKGASAVSSLSLDTLGQVEGWPTGFMEDVTKERLDLLEKMARRAANA
jgi:predicted ATPase